MKAGTSGSYITIILGILALIGISLTRIYNYVLFHTLAEVFIIVIACGVFMIAWNSRQFYNSNYFTFIGIAYLFVALIELLHTMAYKGMGIFQGYDANLPTQLWIVARYMESLSLLAAPLLINRNLKIWPTFLGYAVITALLVMSIFYWRNFPVCFVEGSGLTLFKVASEYIISVILVGAIYLLLQNRNQFDPRVLRLLIASIAITVGAEMAFTLYTDVYGIFNLVGHLLTITSFYLIYRAVVSIGLKEPYALILRDIQQSKEELQRILETTSTGIANANLAGEFIYVNNGLCQMLGYSENDLLGKKFIDFVHPEDKQEIMQSLLNAFTNPKGALNFELRALGKDDAVVYLHASVTNIKSGGQTIGFNAILCDISERKSMEQELQASQGKYQELVENLNDVIFSVDTAGNFTYISPVIEKMGKYKVSEIVGQPFSSFVHPDDLHGLVASFQRALAGKVEVYEFRVLDKNRRVVHVRTSSRPKLENGKAVGLSGVMTDITEYKRAEEATKESEARYRALFDRSLEAVYVHDFEGNFVDANQVALDLLGYNREDIPKLNFASLLDKEQMPLALQILEELANTGVQKGITEFKLRRKDGSYVHVETRASVIQHEGKPLLIQGIARDITERKRMLQHLVLSDRLTSLGDMASGFAHELNNPLSGVIGYAQLLKDRQDLSSDVKRDIELILKEGQRAADVVRKFQVFARKQPPQRVPSDINSLISDVLSIRQREHERNNIAVKTTFGKLPVTEVDPAQMRQVFLNIVTNAEYFMKKAQRRGILSIRTRKRDKMITVSFADNGTGIAAENMKRIFDPFFTTKEIGQGIGLGLSICHSIVTEHGGRMYVESEEGKGATFVVELPITYREHS